MWTEGRARDAKGLNPANLSGVPSDDKDSKVIGAWIGWHEEEANLLRIVGVRGADEFFAIPKSDFGFSAPILGSQGLDRKSTRLNSSHSQISYAVFCLKKKNNDRLTTLPFTQEGIDRGLSTSSDERK